MSLSPEQGDPWTVIRELEQRIATLERTDRAIATSIRAPGRLVFIDGDGEERVRISAKSGGSEANFEYRSAGAADGDSEVALGAVFDNDTGEVVGHGILVQKSDGQDLVRFRSLDGGETIIDLKDGSGNLLLANDRDSVGGGLARPYLTLPFCPTLLSTEQSTTSSTFEDLWRIDGNLQHPRVRVKAYLRSIDGAEGEVRLWDDTDGVQIADTNVVAASAYGGATFTGDVPSSFGEWHDLRLQARVTNATGSIGTEVVYAYGIQS